MNTRSLVQFPQDVHRPSPVNKQSGKPDGESGRLLELRTESGTRYVCPSRWQRLRLHWIFRHFHVLPQQVLSPADQRFIERLSRLPTVTPPLPVGRNIILGVVERPNTRLPEPAQVVTMKIPPPSKRRQDWSIPPRLFSEKGAPGYGNPPLTDRRVKGGVSLARFRQWGALGLLAGVCIGVIVTRFYLVPVRTVQKTQSLTPSGTVAQTAMRAAPRPVSLRHSAKPKLRPTPLPPAPALLPGNTAPAYAIAPRTTFAAAPIESAAMTPGSAERLFVSELPQGHFAAPVVSDPTRVGELHLRALIAADGSVKNVTIVSGDRRLARAGMRAVRRWHYSPDQASAPQAERETLISMKFFGEDAVSVASVAR